MPGPEQTRQTSLFLHQKQLLLPLTLFHFQLFAYFWLSISPLHQIVQNMFLLCINDNQKNRKQTDTLHRFIIALLRVKLFALIPGYDNVSYSE